MSCHKNVSLFKGNLTKSGINYDRKIMKIFSVVNHLEWFLCYTIHLQAKRVTMLLFLLLGIWLPFQRLVIKINDLSIMLIIHNKSYHTNGFPVVKTFKGCLVVVQTGQKHSFASYYFSFCFTLTFSHVSNTHLVSTDVYVIRTFMTTD